MTDTLQRHGDASVRPTRKRRSAWGTMLFVVLLVALGLVASGVLPLQQYFDREAAVSDAEARLAVLRTENHALAEDSAALLTEQEVERLAREQYGFVRPGEIGYVVTTPDALENEVSAGAEPVAAPEPEEVDDRSLPRRIWDFITGNDIVDDG